MKYVYYVVLLLLLCWTSAYAQDSRTVTYLLRDGNKARCSGSMLISSGTGPGSVEVTCQSMPSEQQVLERLQSSPAASVGAREETQQIDAQQAVVPPQEPIVISLAWDPPPEMDDGRPYDPSLLSHYKVYMCDAPIIAGGPGLDNPKVSPASCDGQLLEVQVNDVQIEASYPVQTTEGRLHYRVTAFTTAGNESRLSNTVTHDFQFQGSTAPPANVRIVVEPVRTKGKN